MLREVEGARPARGRLCFGPDAADYRVELYAGYHAERPEVPDELAPQFADAPELLRGVRLDLASPSDSLEADDLLGSLAAREAEAGGAGADPDRRPRHVPVRARRA